MTELLARGKKRVFVMRATRHYKGIGFRGRPSLFGARESKKFSSTEIDFFHSATLSLPFRVLPFRPYPRVAVQRNHCLYSQTQPPQALDRDVSPELRTLPPAFAALAITDTSPCLSTGVESLLHTPTPQRTFPSSALAPSRFPSDCGTAVPTGRDAG